MRLRTVILIAVTLLVGQTGWSQTKNLGDVAGAIKLNPEAIVVKEGVIEDPLAARRADENLFASVLADCRRRPNCSANSWIRLEIPTPRRDFELENQIELVLIDLESAARFHLPVASIRRFCAGDGDRDTGRGELHRRE